MRSPNLRPVFKLKNGHWQRTDSVISIEEGSIRYGALFISEYVDLSTTLGVVSYGAVVDGVPTVFDFSFTHLCSRQLEVLRLHYEDVFKRSASGSQ